MSISIDKRQKNLLITQVTQQKKSIISDRGVFIDQEKDLTFAFLHNFKKRRLFLEFLCLILFILISYQIQAIAFDKELYLKSAKECLNWV